MRWKNFILKQKIFKLQNDKYYTTGIFLYFFLVIYFFTDLIWYLHLFVKTLMFEYNILWFHFSAEICFQRSAETCTYKKIFGSFFPELKKHLQIFQKLKKNLLNFRMLKVLSIMAELHIISSFKFPYSAYIHLKQINLRDFKLVLWYHFWLLSMVLDVPLHCLAVLCCRACLQICFVWSKLLHHWSLLTLRYQIA